MTWPSQLPLIAILRGIRSGEALAHAQALVDGPSLADDFGVLFAWLGAGAPGSQPIEIYGPGFEILETGETVPVPEPASALGVGLGLAALVIRRRVARG